MKKKLLSAIMSGFALAVLVPASTFALASKTDVTGVVTNGGNPVSGAHVTIICDSNVKKTTTDGTGTYLVQYNIAKCPKGAVVHVTATKGKKGGNNTGTANPVTTKLNIALVNVSLPEFGLLTAGIATLIGGAAFVVVRRRQISAHQA